MKIIIQHFENVCPDIGYTDDFFRIHQAQLVRHLNFGSGAEPAGKMIVGGMIVQAFIRQVTDDSFQTRDISCFSNDSAVRIFEYKRAETVILQNEFAQIMQQFGRIFVQKMHIHCFCFFGVHQFFGLQQKWKISDHLPHFLSEFKPGRWIQLPLFGKSDIRNDSQQIVSIRADDQHRFFIRFRQ